MALAGLAVSLAANQVSPRRLDLWVNYFPATNAPPDRRAANQAGPVSADEQFIAQIKANGLQVVDQNQALKLFRDPRFEQGIVVFLDARNEDEFKAGHVPGAYVCDHYRPEKYFPSVFPACQMAEQIVVYCSGGECEDSKHAALMLRDAGVAGEKLLIFVGGITNWITSGLAVELGERNSGVLTNAVGGAGK